MAEIRQFAVCDRGDGCEFAQQGNHRARFPDALTVSAGLPQAGVADTVGDHHMQRYKGQPFCCRIVASRTEGGDRGADRWAEAHWGGWLSKLASVLGLPTWSLSPRRMGEKGCAYRLPTAECCYTEGCLSAFENRRYAGCSKRSEVVLHSRYWPAGIGRYSWTSRLSQRPGLYAWRVMPFGLCNAPVTFES